MSKQKSSQNICKSIFKDGKSTSTSAEFTKKWIQLATRLEQDRQRTEAGRMRL